MSLLELESIEVRYGGLVAVAPLSLTVPAGRMLAVTGPSGAGKTSLLWLMAGALEPDRGSVHLDGSPVGDRPEAASRGIAVVPQGNGLAAVLTAYENIVVPLLDGGVSSGEADTRAREALDVVGLEEWAEHLVEELSGGQQQRVAVARALAARASVLLADEPTSDLDGRNREVVMAALRAAADRGAVVVLATHDPEAAAAADGELALTRVRRLRSLTVHLGDLPASLLQQVRGGRRVRCWLRLRKLHCRAEPAVTALLEAQRQGPGPDAVAHPCAGLGDRRADEAGVHAHHVRADRLYAADAGQVASRPRDEESAAVQVGVDRAGGPPQQLARRPVASDDLDARLDEPVHPLLQPAAVGRVDGDHVGDRPGGRASAAPVARVAGSGRGRGCPARRRRGANRCDGRFSGSPRRCPVEERSGGAGERRGGRHVFSFVSLRTWPGRMRSGSGPMTPRLRR